MNLTTITLIFIISSAVLAIVVKKVKKDKCLKDFRNNMVTLELVNKQSYQGKLQIKSTGLKLNYKDKVSDQSGLVFLSYLMYQNEYPDIQALVRYYENLSAANKQERKKDFARTFNPPRWRKVLRSVVNFLKIIKDAIIEIVNLMTNHLSRTNPVSRNIPGQDEYINRMKSEVYGVVETSYEPLLEDYIGQRVVLELKKSDTWVKYKGVLKDYTSEFIEIIDVNYGEENKQADLIVLRKYGIVRNLSE